MDSDRHPPGQKARTATRCPLRWLRARSAGQSGTAGKSSTQPREMRVTRALCALIHLIPEFCDETWFNLTREPQRAWGVHPHVDVDALLRHAVTARRRLLLRDAAILLIAAYVPAAIMWRLIVRHGWVILMMITVVVMSAHLLRWARREKDHTATTWACVVLVGATLAVAVPAGPRELGTDLGIVASGLGCAWLVSAASRLETVLTVRRLWRGDESPDAGVRRLPSALSSRVAGVPTMNVVVYGEDRRDQPFAGSGPVLAQWRVPIDIDRGARSASGVVLEPKEFSLAELHRYLASRFEDGPHTGLRHGYRLYADGCWLDVGSRLLPDRYGHPVQSMRNDHIIDLAENPVDPEHEWPYFYLESVSHGGELVATFLVRPRLFGGRLYTDLVATALLPLMPAAIGVIHAAPTHLADIAGDVLRGATTQLLEQVRTCLPNTLTRVGDAAVAGRVRHLTRLAVNRSRHIDYGAAVTCREGYATDFKALDHHLRDELDDQVRYLRDCVLGELEQFLKDRDIDTSVFERNSGSVVNTVQNFTVHKVDASTVSFGNANKFLNSAPKQAPDNNGRDRG